MSSYRINGHAHLLPYPDQIPQFMKDQKLFWLDEDRKFMRQGTWKRPVTHPSFFIDEKLKWMEENNIDHEVIITLSQLYCNGYSEEDTLKVFQFQNDFHAETQNMYPTKFTCGFVVQPAYVEQAIAEIDRAVGLGLKVLCLPTHFQTTDGQWKSVFDASTEAIFQKASEYNLAVEIHPYDGPKMIGLEDEYWRFHLIWMCAQTADTHHIFVSRGVAHKFPQLRFCFAHGNQYGHMNYGRRKQGFLGRPDLFKGAQSPENSFLDKNVFYDTLVHDVLSLELMIKRVGSDQILVGIDNPYPLGEMNGVADSYPGKVIDEAVQEHLISEDQRSQMWKENVEAWLGFKIK